MKAIPPKKLLPPFVSPKNNRKHLVKDFKILIKEQSEKLLEEYRDSKKKDVEPNVPAATQSGGKRTTEKPHISDLYAQNDASMVRTELGRFKLSFRIESNADLGAISETISDFLGNRVIFVPTRLSSKAEKLEAIYGRILYPKGTLQIN